MGPKVQDPNLPAGRVVYPDYKAPIWSSVLTQRFLFGDKNTLEEAGFKTYTDKEIKKILNDRAKEIGLDPAIRDD